VSFFGGNATYGLSENLRITVTGPYTLTATSGPLTVTSGSFAITPAAATHLNVAAPANATAGTAASVTVTALDTFNNTDTNYAGLVHFTSTDGAAALPANSTLTNGVGTFSVTLKTAG